MSTIVSVGTAVPAYQHRQDAIVGFAETIHCTTPEERRKLRFLYHHSGIHTRFSTIPDYSTAAGERTFYSQAPDLEPFPTLEQRMDHFAQHAPQLAIEAINSCIGDKLAPQQITHLITVSCTGLSAPGLDLDIMEAMELPADTWRTSVNFMGCYAAIHGLKLADAICKSDQQANVVVVCVELCTLHFQKEPSVDNITSTLLFADGAAAVLVQHNDRVATGLRIEQFYSNVSFKGKKDMSWRLSGTGFLMTLSGYVPELVKEDFDAFITRAAAHAGIDKTGIDYWCIHPGGKKILEAIQQSVQLQTTQLQHAYDVLQQYGNMSSPTILFVLKRIIDEIQSGTEPSGKRVFNAAFGPGLTMESFTAVYG